MIKIILFSIITFSTFANVYKYKVHNFPLDKYSGKNILIVNIATRCGYTPQLQQLETLYQKYKTKLTIIGIPSNDFAGQTPEGNQEVVKFCRLKYNVTFPITSKSVVKGDQKIQLYQYLTKASGGQEVSWNFEKFLISKNGVVIKRFSPSVRPLSQELISLIESL